MKVDCQELASGDVTASAPIFDAPVDDAHRGCCTYQHQHLPDEEHLRDDNTHRACDWNYVMDEIR